MCIFMSAVCCDFMHKTLERVIILVTMPAVKCIHSYEVECSALYKERV